MNSANPAVCSHTFPAAEIADIFPAAAYSRQSRQTVHRAPKTRLRERSA